MVLSGIDCEDEAPIVLKLMVDKGSFDREKQSRVGLGLEEDAKFVVPIIFASDEDPERWEADAKKLAENLTAKLDWPECPKYRYGIMLKRGERDLAAVALRERLGLSAIRDISRQVVRSLVHLHSKDILHADIKSLASLVASRLSNKGNHHLNPSLLCAQNLLRLEDRTWRLIDLDTSVKFGTLVTAKSSLKLVPPEALTHRGMVVARATTDDDPLTASPTFDVWSFGNSLFELAARQPLFVSDGDDGLASIELERLFRWSLGDLASAVDSLQAALRALPDRNLALAVVDLISWCLQPDPSARPQSMADVRAHCFFDEHDEHGMMRMSPLHSAVARNDTAEIMRILDDILDTDSTLLSSTDHLLRKTPLHLAAEELHANAIEALLSRAADPKARKALANALDASGRTAMHALVISAGDARRCPDDETLMRMFNELGTTSDLTLKDRHGRTPMALAVLSPNPKAKALYSSLHVVVQLEAATRSIARQPKPGDTKARRPSLKMIDHAALITPSMDGVKVVALYIGNCAYRHAPPLRNPVNDVELLAKVVRSTKGAEIIVVRDGTKESMDDGLVRFFKLLGPGIVALFGFAGHGLQVDGINYLVPIDYNNPTGDQSLLKEKAVSLQYVQERMEDSNSLVNLCIVDACRENLFTSESRTLATGLAAATAPTGTLLAFATAAGTVASDGKGENGLYTEHLVTALLKEGTLDLDKVMKTVSHSVRKATEDAQKPWMESSLIVDFALFDSEYPPPASSIEQLRAAASNAAGASNATQQGSGATWHNEPSLASGAATTAAKELAEKDDALTANRKELAAKGDALASKEDALHKELAAKNAALAAKDDALAAKDDALAAALAKIEQLRVQTSPPLRPPPLDGQSSGAVSSAAPPSPMGDGCGDPTWLVGRTVEVDGIGTCVVISFNKTRNPFAHSTHTLRLNARAPLTREVVLRRTKAGVTIGAAFRVRSEHDI